MLIKKFEVLQSNQALVSDVRKYHPEVDGRRDSADILQGIKARLSTGIGEDFLFNPAADKSGAEHLIRS